MPKAVVEATTFRFDQMATLINDRVDNPAESGVERYVGLEHLDTDSLRIRRWGEITDVESTKLRFQPGDIIFGKRRVYQRKLAVAGFEGICSAHAMVLRAKTDVVLPEFLPFFMQSDRFMERALEISVGSLSPTINWTALAAEEFALPPIEEQRRITIALQACAHAHDCLLVTANAFADVCDAKLQTLYLGARRGPLSSVAANVTKGTTPTTLGYDYAENEIPFIRAEDVRNREVNVASCDKNIGADAHNALGRSRILPNDVLVTIAGTVGRVGLVPAGTGEANCNQAVAIIRTTDSQDARFLFTWLMSRDARDQMLGGKVTGTISNLSLTSIKSLQVPMLKPEERDQVSSEFEALVNNRERIEDHTVELMRFQRDILNRSLVEWVGP